MTKLRWGSTPAMVGWNKLRALRKSRGLSQPQVAVGADVSISIIYLLEAGFEERTTDRIKKKLAKFFKVDVDDLFPVEMIGDEPRAKFLEKIKSGMNQPITK